MGDEPSPLHLWQPEKLFVRFRLLKRGWGGGQPEMLFRVPTACWQAVCWFLGWDAVWVNGNILVGNELPTLRGWQAVCWLDKRRFRLPWMMRF